MAARCFLAAVVVALVGVSSAQFGIGGPIPIFVRGPSGQVILLGYVNSNRQNQGFGAQGAFGSGQGLLSGQQGFANNQRFQGFGGLGNYANAASSGFGGFGQNAGGFGQQSNNGYQNFNAVSKTFNSVSANGGVSSDAGIGIKSGLYNNAGFGTQRGNGLYNRFGGGSAGQAGGQVRRVAGGGQNTGFQTSAGQAAGLGNNAALQRGVAFNGGAAQGFVG
ncbi:keratin, type II cytoskeletal 2 epidermal [Lingula anatina]|uniref:Keratin, type II cytoskeletal 2 epidermal n=1 Tax=Lingula anatina TaxID=7574 RepID=A0A1S3HS22_LINAN|nr:keratin, type II cytoskeletal 2 epidermal [Lingula anatina]|eukprot:XP_013388837.1 keratin, type II cytoskeletal 2 epidermal [Lingula anatina]